MKSEERDLIEPIFHRPTFSNITYIITASVTGGVLIFLSIAFLVDEFGRIGHYPPINTTHILVGASVAAVGIVLVGAALIIMTQLIKRSPVLRADESGIYLKHAFFLRSKRFAWADLGRFHFEEVNVSPAPKSRKRSRVYSLYALSDQDYDCLVAARETDFQNFQLDSVFMLNFDYRSSMLDQESAVALAERLNELRERYGRPESNIGSPNAAMLRARTLRQRKRLHRILIIYGVALATALSFFLTFRYVIMK